MELVEQPVMLLAKRIRVLINTTGFNLNECYEVIMSVKNPPSEEEFRLAYSAASILTRSDQRADHASQMAILVPSAFRNT